MRVVVLQSNYLPWKGYFDLIQDADTFIFYDEVKYTKNDWRNRNRIYSRHGLHWLTIPIRRDAVNMKISEVPLPKESWQAEHLRTLVHCYRPARHFQQIDSLLQEFYGSKHWQRLSEFNQFATMRISRLLGLRTTFLNSRDFRLEGDRVGRLVSLLRQAGATEYLSGPSAKAYLAGSENLFSEAGIRLRFKTYEGYPAYAQLRDPFEHAVSILDVLANVALTDCLRCITATPSPEPRGSLPASDNHLPSHDEAANRHDDDE